MIVTFYTRGSDYQKLAERLMESCAAHGMEAEAYSEPHQGSWAANGQWKANFLGRILAEKRRPLFWVDADALVRQPFDVGELMAGHDFAAHWRQRPGPKGVWTELLSGTLGFAPTRKAAKLLLRWQYENTQQPGKWDQRTLQTAVDDTPGLMIRRLPPEYTFIFDSMRKQHPDVSPIVEHYQASRGLKQRMDRL